MQHIDEFFVQIGNFVLKETGADITRTQTIIKQHTDKLSQTGDIGFPTTIQPWLNIVKNADDLKGVKQMICDGDDEAFARNLVETSSNWVFPIQMVQFKQFRCLLYLNRSKCYSNVLKTVLSDDASYGQWHHKCDVNDTYAVQLVKQSNNSLVEHRCMLIAKALNNLLRISGFRTQSHENGHEAMNLVEIFVTCARRDGAKSINRQNDMELNNNANVRARSIVCGSVTSRSGLTADDFIRLRSSDMEKLAELKHGQSKESDVIEKCRKLGAAIVTFDLLKVKHFNAIDFEKMITATTTTIKGAAFILYNFARLQTLLVSFDNQVSRGFYDPLPEYENIDFGLLKEEEEWQMFYVYIVGFPMMLERCVSGIDHGQTAIHLLCTFLSNLSALFSVYYHRIKILTENLPQLMPTLYARIYLLKALRTIFLKSLTILEIEPLDQM